MRAPRITWETINGIRQDALTGKYTLDDLAAKYGIHKTTVSKIKNNYREYSTDRKIGSPLYSYDYSYIDIHLCQTCKWFQPLSTHPRHRECFCSYMYYTGERRNSDPSNCNKYEKASEKSTVRQKMYTINLNRAKKKRGGNEIAEWFK